MNSSTFTRTRLLLRNAPIESGLVAAIIVVLLPGIGLAALDLIPIPAQLDFATYYLAAQAMNAGLSPYDRTAIDGLAGAQQGLAHAAYFYPPVFAALIRPLALLPFTIANTLWFGLNLLWYSLGAYLLLHLSGVARPWRLPLFGVGLLVPALHHTLELGQINTLLLALTAGWLALMTQRGTAQSVVGGALPGLAGAFKLFPLVWALPLLYRRSWYAVAGLTGAVISTIVLGIVAGGGVTVSITWLTGILPGIVGGFASPNNQSILAAFVRLGAPTPVEPLLIPGVSPTTLLEPLVNAPGVLRIIGLGLSATIGAVTLLALTRRQHIGIDNRAIEQDVALLIALTLLITPIVWYHYYLLMLIPISFGLRDCWRDPTNRRMILIGCLLIAFQRYWRITVLAGSPLLVSFGTVGALFIWLALVRQRWHSSAAAPAQPNRTGRSG